METELCFVAAFIYFLELEDSWEKYENCGFIWLLTAIISVCPVIGRIMMIALKDKSQWNSPTHSPSSPMRVFSEKPSRRRFRESVSFLYFLAIINVFLQKSLWKE